MIDREKLKEHDAICEAKKNNEWSCGPWTTERSNFEEWEHVGLQCAALRNHELGNWCGYVCVPKDHKYYGLVNKYYLGLGHGGVTYADFNNEEFWLGFDCAHAFDVVPIFLGHMFLSNAAYRDLEYVRDQVNRMAEELVFLN